MQRKKIIWQIFPPFILIIIMSLALLSWFTISELRDFHTEQTIENLKARAEIFIKQINDSDLSETKIKYIDKLCDEAGKSSKTRLTVILPDGKVIGDSEEDPLAMDNHSNRPEIIQAFKGQIGWKIRTSDTLEQSMMYVAIPYAYENRIIAVIRASIPMTSFEVALYNLRDNLIIYLLAISFLATIICLLISNRISSPLVELKNGVKQFSSGNLTKKLPIPKTDEIAVLAEAINDMAEEIDKKIKSIIKNRNEQQAVFCSMTEGVIAVDNNERILYMNNSAEKILNVTEQASKNRFIHEIIRNPNLLDFISNALAGSGTTEGDIRWNDDEERFFQANGTILQDHDGNKIGALIVLNEVTRLYKLEKVRRDFVANVSHELRTPITSIRGFAETIMDEGLEDKEKLKRFAKIIVRQSTRLNSIIEDLLSLSRIEKQSEKDEVNLVPSQMVDVIESAIQSCSVHAKEKRMNIKHECAENIIANINPELLERAFINLIENAIKYSDPEKKILIKCTTEQNDIRIDVIDEGPGIPEEHQNRIFERFYRVDKARSRELGGTGLGLSIVKHISLIHKGNVSVKSTPGSGCTFTIHLPYPGYIS